MSSAKSTGGGIGSGRLYGLGYIARLLGFVFGVPAFLAAVIGWPLPTFMPTPRSVWNAIVVRDYDPKLLVKGLACAMWVVWALMVVSLGVALWNRLRHARVKRPSLVPAVFFRTATKWISGATMVASSLSIRSTPLPPSMIQVEVQAADAVQEASSAVNGQITRGMLKSFAPTAVRENVSPRSTGGSRSYTVAAKQSIWEVAESIWGSDASVHYPQLLDANQDRVADPDLLLSVGTELRIPDVGRINASLDAVSTARVQSAENVLMSEPVLFAAGQIDAPPEAAPKLSEQTTNSSAVDKPLTIESEVGKNAVGRVVVEKGDSFWAIAEAQLASDLGRAATDAEIAPYWRELVAANAGGVASGNVDLIQPGEVFVQPDTGIQHEDVPVAPVSEAPARSVPFETLPLEESPQQTAIELAEVSTPAADTMPSLGRDAVPGSSQSLAVPGMVLTALGAGALLAAISRRRRNAAQGIGSHEELGPLSDEALLRSIRAIASADATMTLDAAQRFLRRQLHSDHVAMPSSSAIRVGAQGLEIRLVEATRKTPTGFVAANTGTSWFLSPNTTISELDDARRGEASLFPSLVSLGTDANGAVLVDLESLGALTIETNDPDAGIGVIAAMIAELEGAPWLDRERIEVAGIGLPSEFEFFERLQLIEEGEAKSWTASIVEAAMTSSLRYPNGVHAVRVERGGVTRAPQIVFVGTGHDLLAKALSKAALQKGSGLAIVSLSALSDGAEILSLHSGGAILRRAGLVVDSHVCLSHDMAVAVGRLVDSSDSVQQAGTNMSSRRADTVLYSDEDWPYDR